jgi:5-formyltetrahydrofolate cyclo-ligase
LVLDGADAKRRLRTAMAERRRRVPPRDAASFAAAIADAVLEEPRIRKAPQIVLYAALGEEVPTRQLFDALRSLPAVRLLPRFERNEMTWSRVEEWDSLVRGRYGVLEPVSGGSETLGSSDVVLLPGLAFDRSGWRLGRGGGHYDRAFRSTARCPWLVGIGYSFQWVAEVPHDDSRDRRVDAIVTENGWVWRVRGST